MDTKSLQAGFDSFLDNKLARLNKNHKIGICAAAVILPAVAFYFLSFSPHFEEIDKLEKSVVALENELKVVKAKAAKLDEQKALMAEMEIKFKEASKVIPDTKEIPNLLTNISSEGSNAGLDILSFTPGVESPKEFYAEIKVALSVTGTYHNVGYFLDTVRKMPRIVNVENIILGSPAMESGEMLLRASINLVTYKFIEPKAP